MGFGKKAAKAPRVGAPGLRPHGRPVDPDSVDDESIVPSTQIALEEDDPSEVVGDLHRKAREALDQNLAPGEPVRVILNMGPRNRRAAIIATDRRLFVFKTGVSAGASFGAKFTSFDFRNIGGISLHTGALTGSAVIDVAGTAAVGSSYWGTKNNDPWKAQNAIPIVRPWDVAKLRIAEIRQLMSDWHERTSAPASHQRAPQEADILDQIQRLGELRDRGLVTNEEFETKKADLLTRL